MVKRENGQAILELALFGAILIMLLGAIVTYGLKYNYQQNAMMTAFRKALSESAQTNTTTGEEILGGQASYTFVADEHIPDPSNPFAIGSVAAYPGSASVVRSFKLHETATNYAELPQTTIEIKGRNPESFKTAAFRDIGNVTAGQLDKYKEVYGETNVCSDPSKGCGASQGVCVSWDPETNTCTEYSTKIRIIDSCAGQIISYDACKRQCRKIVDADFCESDCKLGLLPGSEVNCKDVCSKQIEVPWYCANYTEVDTTTHRYTFPNLEDIFSFAGGGVFTSGKPKSLGLQSDYASGNIINSTLTKVENGATITTTDRINWNENITRSIRYNDNVDTSTGLTRDGSNVIKKEVPVTVKEENVVCVNGVCNK
jgi:hypothetical protein